MANIIDVARIAGVSTTTVSRVLSPAIGYHVAESTRARVLTAAKELGYSPSALAAALVTRRSRIVGALVGDIADPYFAELLRGVEDVALRSGYLLIVCSTDRKTEKELSYVQALRHYSADIILALGGDFGDDDSSRHLAQEIAAATDRGSVAIAVAGRRSGMPSVDIDQRRAAHDMTLHLLGLGHRRIGFIASASRLSTSSDRLAGYRDAMAKVADAAEFLEEGDFTYEGGEAAARRMLRHEPTALFAANDQMALGAYRAVRGAGLSIPDDISIVGFGDTTRATQVDPPLTTVRMPTEALGAMAMAIGLKALDQHSSAPESQTLEFGLAIRGSTGPVPD